MNKDRYQQIRALFHEVCDLDAVQREQRLSEACAGDVDLRRQVGFLLMADGNRDDSFAEQQLEMTRHWVQQLTPSEGRWGSESLAQSYYLPGTRIAGRYRIVSLLGVGGMGEVYRADDMKLGHPVALKFLARSMSHDSQRLQYLFNEVRLSRQISHPNVCRVYDIGEADGIHFLSMEYIDGENLKILLKRIGRLPRAKGIEFAQQICRGLAAAHCQGILHRDLKPANVMIDGRGQVRITDFGLAQLASQTLQEFDGTPAYMAPEQLSRGKTSVQSDIYSLGLVLYELFTGQPFKPGSGIEEMKASGPTTSPAPPSRIAEDLDSSVDVVVLACLETDPSLRPPSADSVANALPGKNSLSAVLAAGEMPPPELVATAGDQRRISIGVATLTSTGILLALGVLGFLSHRIQSMMDIELHELIRVSDAERITGVLGFQPDRADVAWGLKWHTQFFRYFRTNENASGEWRQLTGRSPRPTTFWYRQSTTDLVPKQGRGPYSSMLVTPDDPPLSEPGMCLLILDSDGKLLEWQAVPTPADVVRTVDDADQWRRVLLSAAGLDRIQFENLFARDRVSEANRSPPIFADTWEVWQSKSTSTIVEAAALHGIPVYFRMIQKRPEKGSSSPGIRPIILAVTVLTLFGTALFLAHRNWKSGAADRKGTMRLFLFVMATSLIYWLFQAHHVAGPGEAVMILETLARAMLRGTLICAAYVGVEPYVRKSWPLVLVGWNRLLSNGFFDRQVAGDILIGIVGGLAAQLVGSLGIIFGFPRQFALTADPIVRLGEGPFPLEPLAGIPFAIGQVSRELFVGLVGGFFACLVFVFLLNLILRNRWLAAFLVALFFSFPSFATGDFSAAIVVMTWVLLGFVLLFRFGVLTVVTGWVVWQIVSWPTGFNLAAPYVDIGELGYASVFCLAVVAAHLACRNPQRSFRPDLERSAPA